MATIAVLGGTGALGFGLVLRFAAAGYQVAIGSRDADRAKRAAERATELVPEARVHGMSYADAAADATRLVVITVPFASQADTIKAASPALREGQIVLDTTVPLGPAVSVAGPPSSSVSGAGRPPSRLPHWSRPASGWSARCTRWRRGADRPRPPVDEDTFVAGDKASKQVVGEHLQVVPGLRVIDAGPLEASRLTESITLCSSVSTCVTRPTPGSGSPAFTRSPEAAAPGRRARTRQKGLHDRQRAPVRCQLRRHLRDGPASRRSVRCRER